MEVPKNIEKIIKERVRADLEPSDFLAYSKSGISFILGGGLSLALCGQFGMALTPLAGNINHQLHHSLGPLWCAVICGALFSIAPVIVLRALTSPMQFRALLRKKWLPQMVLIIFIGALLSHSGTFGFDFLLVFLWSIGALVVFRALGSFIDHSYRLSPS